MKQACVVIPIYKSFDDLSREELHSFGQAMHILGSHEIFFACSHNFEPLEYLKKCKELKISAKIKKFDDKYFHNIQGYNQLMLSVGFYRQFKTFCFILIYQLDAFVFRDDLDYWCKKGYDYIGAPWFEGWNEGNNESNIIGVGNGGFSLRKINSTLRILKSYTRLTLLRSFWLKSKMNYFISYSKLLSLLKLSFHITSLEKANELFDNENTNEDYFLSQILGNSFTYFKIAPYSEAIKFSFEVNPSLLYSMNGDMLPFGCHAWEKYEPEFWRRFISERLVF